MLFEFYDIYNLVLIISQLKIPVYSITASAPEYCYNVVLNSTLSKSRLTLCIRETPKQVLFTNSEVSDEMPHDA